MVWMERGDRQRKKQREDKEGKMEMAGRGAEPEERLWRGVRGSHLLLQTVDKLLQPVDLDRPLAVFIINTWQRHTHTHQTRRANNKGGGMKGAAYNHCILSIFSSIDFLFLTEYFKIVAVRREAFLSCTATHNPANQ